MISSTVVSIQIVSLLLPVKTANLLIPSYNNVLTRVLLSILWHTTFVNSTFLMVPVNQFVTFLSLLRTVIVIVKTTASTDLGLRNLGVLIHFVVVVLLVSIKSPLICSIRWLLLRSLPRSQHVRSYSFECIKLEFAQSQHDPRKSPMVWSVLFARSHTSLPIALFFKISTISESILLLTV